MSASHIDRLLSAVTECDASDLHLIVGVPPAFRVNGEIILANEDALTETDLTAMAEGMLNEQQRKKLEQDWELCISMHHSAAGRVRVTYYRRNGHTEMSLRFCGHRIASREELGLPEKIDDLARKPNGLVLVTGPTGAGKTTTLNYLVDLINGERRCKIVTIEDPIEFVHENKRALVVQQEVLTDVRSFNRALIHVLRQDPDVIVVGEMRDHEAIATALTAAETGHLVLATMHSPNVSHAMERIIGVFEGNAQRQIIAQLANSLQGIIAQDLLAATDRSRRVLACEMLVANGAVRNMIRENQLHQLENVIQMGRKEGMMLMDNCLYDLYCKCLISYDTAVSRARNPERILARKKMIENFPFGRARLQPSRALFRQSGSPGDANHYGGALCPGTPLPALSPLGGERVAAGRERGSLEASPYQKVLACCALLLACAAGAAPPDADIARFIAAKSNQVYLASRDSNTPVPPEVWQVFAAASAGDWNSISNLLQAVQTNYYTSTSHRLEPGVWYRAQEVGGFGELAATNNMKFIRLFADEIFKVVPSGSIYFGGTDPGRFAVTALSRSQEEGKPFLTLTQNQLVDTNYLTYARGLYRQQIELPGEAKVRDAFDEYIADARRRFEHDQQFPNQPKQVGAGEDIRMVNGRPQISGAGAVMAINGLLARAILQANPSRECYLEESYSIDWMYPYLEPAGPIFQLRHAPREALFEEAVRNDHEYWQRLTRRLIGQEIHDETDLAEVCAAAEELVGKPKDFHGDPDFLRDEGARLIFSKLRSSGSGLYAWRAAHAKSTSERRQMEREAELACKQAYLLFPRSPEAIWHFAVFLISVHRAEDAQKFLAAARKLNPDNKIVDSLAGYAATMAAYEKTQR